MSTSLIPIGWIVVIFVSGTAGTKCYRSESLGDRDVNVYYCDDPDKPACCDEGGQFTCCEEDSDKTLREQLTLWGVVLGVILLISIGCCYFWKDCACCKDDQPRNGCCCCRQKPDDDQKDLTSLETPHNVTSHKPQWPARSHHFRVGDIDQPETPPPFKFKSPSTRH